MNLYQPTITGSLSISGSVNISGSITIAGGGTISGTASIATTALTASSADNFLVRNTLTAQTLVVQTITSSVDFVTGSTRFGSLLSNTHVFSGSVSMNPNGLFVSGSGRVGVGTTDPLYKLHVEEAAPRIYIRATGSGGDAGVFMKASSSFAGGWTVKDDGNRNFWIYSDYASATRLYIDSIGNIGINGVTPTSAWGSNTKAIQIGSGSLYNDGFNNILIANNSYFNGSNNTYVSTGYASRYFQEFPNGNHYFQVAPSGNAGSSFVYTSSLFIKNNGFIGVNTESPSVRFHVVGGNENGIRSIVGGTYSPIQFSGDNNITSGSINAYNGVVVIGRTTAPGTGVNPDIAINSSGNVGIGIQSPSSSLHVVGTIRSSTGANYTSLGYDGVYCNTSNLYLDAGNYDMRFYTGNTSKATLTSGGYFRLATAGIQFNGDTADANSLDDYEEGTINIATLTDGSSTLSQFTGNQTLSYTKIGNRVYVNGNIYNQSISGTWSSPLRIPLPFTAASGDGRNRSYGHAALYNWGSTDNIYLIEAGSTYATLVSAGSGGPWGTITTSSGFTAIVNFSYITS